MPVQPSEAVLDGMTIMQAGELLLDVVPTKDARRLGGSTYERSLEDFAFAIVYFDRLLLVGSTETMQWRKGESPGPALLRRFPGAVRTVPTDVSWTPEQLLGFPDFKDLVAGDLNELPKAIHLGRTFFRSWIAREAEAYLGEHPSIFQPWRRPGEFLYGAVSVGGSAESLSDPRNYLMDRALQGEISPTVISTVAGFIPYATRHGASSAAINEFVSRNLLQLTALLHWREAAFDFAQLILPHCTRAAICQARIPSASIPDPETRSALVARALAMALKKKPKDRDELIDAIGNIRESGPIPRVRKAISDLLNEEDPGSRVTLQRDMRRMLGLDMQPDEVIISTIDVSVPRGVSSSINPRALLHKVSNHLPFSRGRAFRKLGSISRKTNRSDLRRLCPELGFSRAPAAHDTPP